MSGKTNINIEGFGMLLVLLFALSFCGEPDLHDSLIKYVDNLSACENKLTDFSKED